jgi:lysophospholipase L1-like esterase
MKGASQEKTSPMPAASVDGLHPSDLGYIHWAEALWAVVEQAIDE